MERTNEQQLVFTVLKAALGSIAEPMDPQQIDWNAFMEIIQEHRLGPLLSEGLRALAQPVPPGIIGWAQQAEMTNSFNYYSKADLLFRLLEDFHSQNLHVCVLKGCSLNALYPKEESRVFSDLDLFFPDPDGFEAACRILEEKGAVKNSDDFTDYHVSYTMNDGGQAVELEIHRRLCGSFGVDWFDKEMSTICTEAVHAEPFDTVTALDTGLDTLPVTLNALYLLIHMFQHFMGKGFGLRLFCDWTVFWNAKGTQVDAARFLSWIDRLHLRRFLNAVTSVSLSYLGLDAQKLPWPLEQGSDLADDLLQDVLAGGEFGKQDKERIVITARKDSIGGYLHELHRQMKKRYPDLSKFSLLWPALWVATGAWFVYNNVKLRKISTIDVLKKSSERSRLAQQMRIFQ